MAQGKQLSAADAMKAFKGKSIVVQVATPVKVKGEDGKRREGFETKGTPLAEEHVLSACDCGDRIVMVTIDGRKYETAAKGAAA